VVHHRPEPDRLEGVDERIRGIDGLMGFRLADAWTWDMWFADDGEQYHVFYLKASRALLDERRRHLRAGVGHAVSDDLRTWTELPDALVASDGPAFDDQATWTGSVVRGDDGVWRMFYTGCSRAEQGVVQRIGVAISDDLVAWHRTSPEPVCEADPRWYEKLADGTWGDEAWRDPWVFRDPDGHGWHMLITARAAAGAPDERGVIGHATSTDLAHWTVGPPLSRPGAGFGQLEVPQVAVVDGRGVLLVNCLHGELSAARRAAGERGGVWAVPADSLTGPFDVARAARLTDESVYSGRLVQDRAGTWWLLAFPNVLPDGTLPGGLTDPMPVHWGDGGRLRVEEGRFGPLQP
jgi:beta-fructofuranosidase